MTQLRWPRTWWHGREWPLYRKLQRKRFTHIFFRKGGEPRLLHHDDAHGPLLKLSSKHNSFTSTHQRRSIQESIIEINQHTKTINQHSLLVWRQPAWHKISWATIRSRMQPETMASRCPSGESRAQSWTQWETIWRTCKKLKDDFLLKIMSFLILQIDQHKADTPIRKKALDCLFIPFNQLPNILVIMQRNPWRW
jgi:hypothetical protein